MKTKLLTMIGLCALMPLSSCTNSLNSDSNSIMAQAPGNAWQWGSDLDQALRESKKTGLPVVVAFLAPTWCPFCKSVDRNVLSKQEFANGMQGVAIGVQFDFPTRGISFESIPAGARYQITGIPTFVVVNSNGTEIGRIGYLDNPTPEKYLQYFRQFKLNKR